MSTTTLLYSQADQTITPLSATLRLKSLTPIPYQAPAVPQQTRSQPPPSRLLSLPAELRLQIYTLALHSTPRPSKPLDPVPPHQHPLPLLTTHHRLALLLVNHQIYTEARLLPFTTNTFMFTKTFGSSAYSGQKFLGQLERWQRGAVRRVEVSVVWRWEEELRMVCGLLGGRCVVIVRVGKEVGGEEVGQAGVFPREHDVAISCREEDSWVRGMIEKRMKRDGFTVEFIWA